MAESKSQLTSLKITILGDCCVGKSSLLITYKDNSYTEVIYPTVFENYETKKMVDDKEYNLTLCDTSGGESYDRLRPLSYPNTDCFLICYSISSRPSFENILEKWYPEVKYYSPDAPIILVGNKMDLRVSNSEEFVTTAEANKLYAKIKAHALVECSTKEQVNLDEILCQAARAAETYPRILKPLKITTVGDGMVGKTCLLITYTQNSFPEEYVPTVFDNEATTIMVDGREYNITLWDTAGQETYDSLRPLLYPNTDCFLICYSISSKASFENILAKWYPEVRHFSPNVPIILVGTKMDLRVPNSEEFVTTAEAKKLCAKIKAYALVECSTKERIHIKEVFEEAVRSVKNKPENIVRRKCLLL